MNRRECYPDPDTEPRDPSWEDADERDRLADEKYDALRSDLAREYRRGLEVGAREYRRGFEVGRQLGRVEALREVKELLERQGAGK